jgi:Spy/CpxP family protein refolding chaperone
LTRNKGALDAAYKRLNDLRQQRFDAQLAARDQMVAVLTNEQREQLKHCGPWWLGAAE